MSALLVHAQAARIIGETMIEHSVLGGNRADTSTMHAIGFALTDASLRMEAVARAEAKAHQAAHGCTIDHRAMVMAVCVACGARKVR